MVKSTKGNSPEEDTMSQNLNFTVDGLAVELPRARKDYFCQYLGREYPQGAYLQLRMSAEPPHLCATFNGEVGTAVPEDVYHGHTLRFDFPCTALLKDVRGAMKKVASMCAELAKSYNTRFDGQSMVGVFDHAQRDRIQETLDTEFGVERW
jgi:hypothetical protein